MPSPSLLKAVLKPRGLAAPAAEKRADSKIESRMYYQPPYPAVSEGARATGSSGLGSQSQTPLSKPTARPCLCAPTKHPGSFRCRQHRLQATSRVPSESRTSFSSTNESSRERLSSTHSVGESGAVQKNVLRPGSRLRNMTTAAGYSDLGSNPADVHEEGPFRFLRYAATAGAAAAAVGAGAMLKNHSASELWGKMASGALPLACVLVLNGAPLLGSPSAIAAGGLNPDGGRAYEVVKGDNLSAISKKLGTTVDVLMAANGLKTDVIQPGQRLWIPKTYTIQKGDTLYKIAKEYKTTVGDILKVNSVDKPDLISPGDILLLP